MPRKQTNFSVLDKMAFAVGALAGIAITMRELHARTVTDDNCRMSAQTSGGEYGLSQMRKPDGEAELQPFGRPGYMAMPATGVSRDNQHPQGQLC